jgi:hypothetical protein
MLRLSVALLLLAAPALAAEPDISPERQAQLRAIAEACRADAQKFCADMEPGKGDIVKCLRGNETRLSQQCRTLLPGAPKTPLAPPKKNSL